MLPGHYRRELRPATGPLNGRHRRCISSQTGKNPALQEASYTEDTGGGSVQHAAIALIRPRRQQHLRLPAITCDTHCKVYNRTTPVFANYKVSCLNYK